MNDDPGQNAPLGDGSRDPLDDTQRIDVPRYAPTPDPRPDARWAWASPGQQPQADRWYQPAPAEPGAQGQAQAQQASTPRAVWGSGSGSEGSTTPPPAYTAPVGPATPSRRRGGTGLGTVVTASLLSAVLAAGGTVAVLSQTG